MSKVTTELCAYIRELREERDRIHVKAAQLELQLRRDVDGLRTGAAAEQERDALKKDLDQAYYTLSRILSDGGLFDLGPYLEGRVEVPNVPQLRADVSITRDAHVAAEQQLADVRAEHLVLDRQYMDRCKELDASKARERTLLKELADTNRLLNEVRNAARQGQTVHVAHPAVEMARDALHADAARDVIAELWCNGYGGASPYPLSAWGSREDAKAASSRNTCARLSVDAEHYHHDSVVVKLRAEVAMLTQALTTSSATVEVLRTACVGPAKIVQDIDGTVRRAVPGEAWLLALRNPVGYCVAHAYATQRIAQEKYSHVVYEGGEARLYYPAEYVAAERTRSGQVAFDTAVRAGQVAIDSAVRAERALCVCAAVACGAEDVAQRIREGGIRTENASMRGESDDDGRTGSGGT